MVFPLEIWYHIIEEAAADSTGDCHDVRHLRLLNSSFNKHVLRSLSGRNSGLLFAAAALGHTEHVQLLRKDVIAEYRHRGRHALSLAVQHGQYEVAELLLQRPGVEVNWYMPDRAWPCTLALRRRDTRILELLLRCPDIHITNTLIYRKTTSYGLLAIAASLGYIDAIKLILDHPNFVRDVKHELVTALAEAVKGCHVEAVTLLMNHPLISRIEHGQLCRALCDAIVAERNEVVLQFLGYPSAFVAPHCAHDLLTTALSHDNADVTKRLLDWYDFRAMESLQYC